MPKPFSLKFTPPFETEIDVPNLDSAPNLLEQSRAAHVGLRYITVVRVTKGDDGKPKRKQINRIDVVDAEPGRTPSFSPALIASTCTAMAIEDATERSKSAYYLVTFYGCRAPGSTKAPYRFAQFKGSPMDEEEVETDDESEGGDDASEGSEEGEDEEEEEEDEEPELQGAPDGEGEQEDDEPPVRVPRLVGDPGAGEPWNSHARPGDRHEALAPRIEHVPPAHMEAAFPPGAMPPEPTPEQLGRMTTQTHGGMEHYAAMMHPAQSLFLHHLGGVFAETRASMREMRQDVREARAEAKAATERLIQMSTMGSSHLEAMHKTNQIGWDALHQGMTMQLNSLQNSLAWERRIMELQHGNQGGGAGMMIAQVLLGLIPQVIAGVAMWKGVPPEQANMLGQMMGGGMMPGGMPGGGMPGLPGAPPPGFAPPAPPAAPPPGFNGHGGPPMGFAPPSAPPPPGFAPPGAAPPPPGFFDGNNGPPGGFAMPPVAQPEPTGVQFRPSSTPAPMPPPASPVGPMGPGPFGVMPPSGPMGTGPFGVMQQMPPPPMGAVPSVDHMRARFQQAPLCAMIETLLVSTASNGGQQRLIQAGCGNVLHALQVCHGAATDHDARDRLAELGRLLSTPGVTEAVVQQFVGEERLIVADIRDNVRMFMQPSGINFGIAQSPTIGWPPPPGASAPPAAPVQSAIPVPPTPPIQMEAAIPMPAASSMQSQQMRLVPDVVAPTLPQIPMPSVVSTPQAPVVETPDVVPPVHVDDVEPPADASPATMRKPVPAKMRKPKGPPRPAH